MTYEGVEVDCIAVAGLYKWLKCDFILTSSSENQTIVSSKHTLQELTNNAKERYILYPMIFD